MSAKLAGVSALSASLVAFLFVCSISSRPTVADQIQLSSVLPKLQAIHEDTKNLLMKNSELKATIQAGVKLQGENANQQTKAPSRATPQATAGDHKKRAQPAPGLTVSSVPKPVANQTRGKSANKAIDYMELEEFNEWVDLNLEYAVKNTRASIEALKEEAQNNNGTIEYSEQAVQDGIEGVRYWQSAVIFQDKTMKNEKFDVEE